MALTKFGGVTKSIFLNDAESHKLRLAFTVADAIVVKRGMPLKLNADGEVTTVAADGSEKHLIIGYSLHDGIEGDEITLAVRAYATIWAMSKTASNAGPVFYTGLDSVDDRYSNYEDTGVTAANMNGFALDKSTAAHQAIRVAIF